MNDRKYEKKEPLNLDLTGEEKILKTYRDNKYVHLAVKDSQKESKAGVIFTGKNQTIKEGEYINAADISQALQKYFSSNDDETYVVNKVTDEKTSLNELMNQALKTLENSNGFVVGGSNPKFKNQNTVTYHTYNESPKNRTIILKKGEEKPKPGIYINKEEMNQALLQYMQVNERKEKPETFGVKSINPHFKINPKWILMLEAAVVAFTGLGINTDEITNANYNITEQNKVVYEQEAENYDKIISSLTTGSKIDIKQGVEYYYDSDKSTDIKGTIGNTLRPAGEYDIEYIAVVHDNEIKNVTFEKGVNVEEFVKETSQKENFPEDEANVMLHLGGPVAGWADLQDVINSYGPPVPIIHVEYDNGKTYSGTKEDFQGNITINDNGTPVNINVLDDEGNALKPGDVIDNADGRYVVNELDVNSEEKTTGINWSVENIKKRQQLFAEASLAAIALGLAMGTKKKKESEAKDDFTSNTNYVINEERLQEEKNQKEFEEAKSKYQQQSLFTKITNWFNKNATMAYTSPFNQNNERGISR